MDLERRLHIRPAVTADLPVLRVIKRGRKASRFYSSGSYRRSAGTPGD
jgi:hypothetical protein